MVMKQGERLDQRAGGFTIVETMVVLAVTGALFVVVAASLSGRQSAAEFIHAIQSAQSQVQQVVNQVSAGFYPNQGNFTCARNGNAVALAAGSKAQGTNQDCIFLGKVLQFGVQGTSGSDPEQYRVYTIAGLRCPTCTVGAASPFQNVSPTVVGVGGDYTSYSDVGALEYGLYTRWIHIGGTSVGAVGFLMEPGSLSTATNYNSGAQQVDIVPIFGSTLNQDALSLAARTDSTLNDTTLVNYSSINPQGGVQICLVSGGTNQSGLITIGGSGRQLLVNLSIMSNTQCVSN